MVAAMAHSADEDVGTAYDLVEAIWAEGQPPEPDWAKLATLAADLAELAARLSTPHA